MVDEAQRQRQYIGESPNFSRGLLDVRYPVDSAVQNAHRRPSNRQPLLNQSPMERPSYDWPGQPSYGEWMQQIVPPQSQQRPHVNPRMRHINPRGMDGGLGRLRRPESFTNMDMFNRPDLSFRYSHMDPEKGDESIRGTWRRMQDARRANEMDEYGYLEGAPRQRTTFTEGYMDPVDFNEMYGGVYDDEILRNQGIMGALPGEYETSGIYQQWKTIASKFGETFANEWLAKQQAV